MASEGYARQPKTAQNGLQKIVEAADWLSSFYYGLQAVHYDDDGA